ncbi:MAG: hypothetical protein ABI857_04000 [Acidobacteriota bacterium]
MNWPRVRSILFPTLIIVTCTVLSQTSLAQSPTPSPTPVDRGTSSGNGLTSTVEIGLRGVHVNGNDNKYRSDLNYRPGFRVFDSSFLVENKEGHSNFFDSALVTTSGWGGDPTGMFRLNMERKGFYRLDSNIRRVKYFNNLTNHALNQHNANTDHGFGDMDLTIFPERESLRYKLGYSFNRTGGDGGSTTRAYGDEFGVLSNVKNSSDDFRAGVEGKVLGFNLGLNYGFRKFNERTNYFIEGINLGNNPTNSTRLFTFQRFYPIEGTTNFAQFHAQRTFASKVDFTARLIHSQTSTKFSVSEMITGRDNSNNQVDLDRFAISGGAKRPQTRGDLGMTWRATDKFRISNTFTYDQFNISGGNAFFEELRRRNAAGVGLPAVLTSTLSHRVTAYRRATNLIEADYQVNKRFGFNIGYRFTSRKVRIEGSNRNLATPTVVTIDEDFENQTHGFIAGFKAKPVNNWVIFFDVEHGKADNVFTRLSNYDFTNFRFRTRANIKTFSINASFISRSNDNPSRAVELPTANFTAETRSQTFATSVDWTPMPELILSSGYTFQHLNARADIIVPIAGVRLAGISQYFVRDSYFFFDVHAKPIKRVSVFSSYRISDDRGQGGRVSTRPQDIITSYPMRFQSPEVRLAIRLTNNIDWNLGYQYYDYKERLTGPQNYNAHLPYTSLRFYFGKAAADR